MIKAVTKFGDEVIINEKNITVCTLTIDKNIFISFTDGSSVLIKESFDSFYKKLIDKVSITPTLRDLENTNHISTIEEESEQPPIIKEGLVTIPKPKGKPGRKPGFKLNKT